MLASLVLSVALLLPSAEAKPGKEPPEPPRPQVGKPAPAFALEDQDGKEVKLAALLEKGNVLLAFYPKDFTGG